MSKIRAFITVALMAIMFAYTVIAALPIVLVLLIANAIDPAPEDKKLVDVINEVTAKIKTVTEKK